MVPKMKVPVDLPSNPQSAAAQAAGRKKSDQDQALAKSCQDFEAIFLHALFKGMRAGTIESGLLEKGQDREIFQDMMDMEVANVAASQNSLGIGQTLLKQLKTRKD